MRALETLQEKLAESLGFLHSKRLDALWRLVSGLLRGQQLWLSELGRNLPGTCSVTRHIRTASPRRLDVLFLIGALAAVAMQLLGIATRGSRVERGLQANTVRDRNVLSTFFLGRLVLKQKLEAALTTDASRKALAALVSALHSMDRQTA
jgi:hypothetical protein